MAPIGAGGGITSVRDRRGNALPQAPLGGQRLSRVVIQLPFAPSVGAGVPPPLRHDLAACKAKLSLQRRG